MICLLRSTWPDQKAWKNNIWVCIHEFTRYM